MSGYSNHMSFQGCNSGSRGNAAHAREFDVAPGGAAEYGSDNRKEANEVVHCPNPTSDCETQQASQYDDGKRDD